MIHIDAVAGALKQQELFLEYLPTVSLVTGRCIGAEALVRWRRGTEVLMPDQFIPSIENTPLSGLITYWVIETVARELGSWLRQNDDVHLSINVPPELLGRGGMEYAALKSGLADLRSKIILEVTERGVPDKLGVDALNQARKNNVRVALDDVGAGGANLAILCRVHIDMIKLDKSFANQLRYPNNHSKGLETLAAIMRNTDLDIVAEGVEYETQAAALKEAGVKMAQGFYFSLPLSAKDFVVYHRSHQ